MKKVIWEVEYLSPPTTARYCKKCSKKTEHVSSGLFRINAQQKCLDIWLIYRCSHCKSTWNLTLYSRANPKILGAERLERFNKNDQALALQYAMDTERLRRNGAEVNLPRYRINGENINSNSTTEVSIISKYQSDLRVSKVLREKLGLSRKDLEHMLDCGIIRSVSGSDLRKSKLQKGVVLVIGPQSPL